MTAKAIMRRNKTLIQRIFSGDYKLILNKVYERNLITEREYNNLKGIYKENMEGHTVELVDTLMDKGEERCRCFLNLLETDDEIKDTFPNLKTVQLSYRRPSSEPMDHRDDGASRSKMSKKDESYKVDSYPTGLCLILNNMNFKDGSVRLGTDKDADSVAEVFSWLGFRVVMCKDQTMDEMNQTLKGFSDLSDPSLLQQFSLKQWSSDGFVDLQQPPEHGDAFICCILSHGNKGVVYGIDRQSLPIKDITRTFKATSSSPLIGKPKVFLIQACQGSGHSQRGVLHENIETDECFPVSVPEEADVLVAVATVEDYVSFRHKEKGSWFIQALCKQLTEGCSRGDDINSILQRVNSDVSLKEGNSDRPGQIKQMSEVHYTLRKKLVLSPRHN